MLLRETQNSIHIKRESEIKTREVVVIKENEQNGAH